MYISRSNGFITNMRGLVTDSSSAKKPFRVISTRIFCDISMTPAFPVNNDCHDSGWQGGSGRGLYGNKYTRVYKCCLVRQVPDKLCVYLSYLHTALCPCQLTDHSPGSYCALILIEKPHSVNDNWIFTLNRNW